jgi:HSP20 family protein
VRLTLPTGLLVPAVEMTETKKAYKLNIEVPGMEAADIEMHVQDDTILVSGEKKERREEDEKGYSYSERSYGAFERRIEVPPGADAKGIKAKVRNGVLEITVPKKPEAAGQRNRIEIESA